MENAHISVCQVVASINIRTGGPAVSVPALAAELERCGVASPIVTIDDPRHGPQNLPAGVRVASIVANALSRNCRGASLQFGAALAAEARTADIVHSHGVWMMQNREARIAALGAAKPLVISPRGMLEAWSLAHGAWKKRLAWLLYEGKNMRAAAAFHATSSAEAESIRALGLRAPIAVIPNGVACPPPDAIPARSVLDSAFPALRDRRFCLFLSRLHPKKGIELLLAAWARETSGRVLLIAGPGDESYRAVLAKLACESGCESRVILAGMVEGPTKAALLAHADLLVLPTHSENFGMVVAESLAHGTPTITTKGTPWRDLATHRCGWWIERDADALLAALNESAAMSIAQLREMGAHGRNLVESKYSWHRVGRDMAAFYRWLVQGADRPSFVIAG